MYIVSRRYQVERLPDGGVSTKNLDSLSFCKNRADCSSMYFHYPGCQLDHLSRLPSLSFLRHALC